MKKRMFGKTFARAHGRGCIAFLVASAVGSLWAGIQMPAVFSDNMVLQKGVPVQVRGSADPSEKIAVEFAGQRKQTAADTAGKWAITLDALSPFSEPAEMRVTGKKTVTIRNILVGDVWLASGQSNMAMAVRDAENAGPETAAANWPGIRFFKVAFDVGSSPKEDCVGKWIVCSPADVGAFSAAAYYFARELHGKYRIPVGVINSAVGASSCQAWTPAEVLTADKSLPQLAAMPPENYSSWKVYDAYRKDFYNRHVNKDTGVKAECFAWAQPGLDVSDWKDVKVPGSIESQGMAIDGAIWFRKEVDIPPAMAGADLTLALLAISDNDITFVNGEKVGATDNNWREWVCRSYRIPAKRFRVGRNVIAVRIFNALNSGGFCPVHPTAAMKLRKDDGNEIALAGLWKCKVETALAPARLPFALPSSYSIPAAFYNAMIAPFMQFPVRGFIWYQGESNAGATKQHDVLFPAMIESWRRGWGNGKLPFYFVQLASLRARKAQPSEGGWPLMRESQLKTLALHDTGMAVTIDIGDANNIHPKNKQDVGKRLARWAMRDCFGDKEIEVSGPLYVSDAVEVGKIRIRFTHTGGGLTAKGGELKGFAIAAADKKFVWAKASIEGDSVVVWNENVKTPLSVRYAWADNPECTLYNGAGLPASPFRTDRDE